METTSKVTQAIIISPQLKLVTNEIQNIAIIVIKNQGHALNARIISSMKKYMVFVYLSKIVHMVKLTNFQVRNAQLHEQKQMLKLWNTIVKYVLSRQCLVCNQSYSLNRLTGNCDLCQVYGCADCNENVNKCNRCIPQFYIFVTNDKEIFCINSDQSKNCSFYNQYQALSSSTPNQVVCNNCSSGCGRCNSYQNYCTAYQDYQILVGNKCKKN
ncbi:hypothetical protein ABPG72_006680 [Tetrahymena utriculariae]